MMERIVAAVSFAVDCSCRVQIEHQEAVIAKGQKTSNREVRKPKAAKPAAAAAGATTPSLLTKGMLTPVGMPKKRH